MFQHIYILSKTKKNMLCVVNVYFLHTVTLLFLFYKQLIRISTDVFITLYMCEYK